MVNVSKSQLALTWLGITVALGAAGCLQQSLSPLFLQQDSVFDGRLLGDWTCGDERWTFSRESDSDLPGKDVYSVVIDTGNRRDTLGAILGRIDDDEFISFMPGDGLQEAHPAASFVGRHSMGVYTFGRVDVEAGRLRLAMLGTDWVKKAYLAGLLPIGVSQQLAGSTEVDPNVILTAGPAQLQRFARVYKKDAAVFSEEVELVRAAPDGTPAGSGGRCYSER